MSASSSGSFTRPPLRSQLSLTTNSLSSIIEGLNQPSTTTLVPYSRAEQERQSQAEELLLIKARQEERERHEKQLLQPYDLPAMCLSDISWRLFFRRNWKAETTKQNR